MTPPRLPTIGPFAWLVLLLAAAGVGCVHHQPVVPAEAPKELRKVNHPAYMIEPPDILEIDTLSTVPLPPYHIRPLDVIGVKVPGAFKENPIDQAFPVDPDGTINLGLTYGPPVPVAGLTIPEAKKAIEDQLAKKIKENTAEVVLVETRAAQQIRGRHLVRSDGTVSLGEYGSVNVSGLTIPAAKAAVEAHLSQSMKDPQVTIDVLAFNSKVYYVVLDGGGAGQQVVRLPVTGNETVLDAISQVSGLTAVSDAHRIWVSRPGPDGCSSVLPVDWNGLTARGEPATNYQLLPGDRVFVQAYPAVRADNVLARAIAPIERLFGVALLGNYTVRGLSGQFSGGGGFGGVGIR